MSKLFFFIGCIVSVIKGTGQPVPLNCSELKKDIKTEKGSWVIFEGYRDKKGNLFKNDLELYIFNASYLNTSYFLDSLKNAYSFITPSDTQIYNKCNDITFMDRSEYELFLASVYLSGKKDSIKLKKKLLINFPRSSKKISLLFIKFEGTVTYLDYDVDTKKYPLYFYNIHQEKRLQYVIKEVPIRCLIKTEILTP